MEREVGCKKFWWIFLFGGVMAGLGWFAVAYAVSFLPPLDALTHWMPQAVRQALGLGKSVARGLDAGLLIGELRRVAANPSYHSPLFT